MSSPITQQLIRFALLLGLVFAGGAPASASDDLLRAADAGDVARVKQLIARGANVNTRDQHGRTPLIQAASAGRQETVRMLLDAGANPNLQTADGATALSLAAAHHLEIVRMLLDAGADVDKGKGLVQAAWYGQREIVRMLLKASADVNVQTRYECTPLFAASSNDHREIVRTLIAAGADVHIMCRHGITAMGATYNPRIIYALLMAGDDIRHLNLRLVLDLAAALPTLAAILLGVFVLVINHRHIKQAAADAQRTLRLANNRRMYRFYAADTAAFLLAYLSFIFFPRSVILLAILGGLFVAANLLLLLNESNKTALPERYTWYPSLLFAGGLAGMGATGLMWGILHFLDW